MNGLSWLLYAGDVVGNLRGVLFNVSLSAGLGLVFGGGGWVAFSFTETFDYSHSPPSLTIMCRKVFKFSVGILICAAVLSAVIPSRSTLMLIAASEVGETVLASKEAQNIGGEAGQLATDNLRLLRKYVTEQLDAKPADPTT